MMAEKVNPANHCVPILDDFVDDEDSSVSYMVMPFLRLTDKPPFEIVDDIVDLMDQLLEVRQHHPRVRFSESFSP
jgi:hypothetical protein